MEEIFKKTQICIETNENENMTTQNLWDSVKAVIRLKFIALQVYLKKQEEKKKKTKFTPNATRKISNQETQGKKS